MYLQWVFVAVGGLSLVAVSGGYSLVEANGLLIAVASLVLCPMTCGVFPDQGSKPCPPVLAGGFLAAGPPGKS